MAALKESMKLSANKGPMRWLAGSIVTVLILASLLPVARHIANEFLSKGETYIEEAKTVVRRSEEFQQFDGPIDWVPAKHTVLLKPNLKCVILCLENGREQVTVRVIWVGDGQPHVRFGATECE